MRIKFVELPTDDKGVIPEELEKILKKYGDKIRLAYVIPGFQNPTGVTWPIERRKAFMELINQYNFRLLKMIRTANSAMMATKFRL